VRTPRTIGERDAATAARDGPALAAILRAGVEGGASVNVLLRFSWADRKAHSRARLAPVPWDLRSWKAA
jgi:hypothetical protein